MSFRARMVEPVDVIPVWQYLLNKVAHTALIAWALVCVFPHLRLLSAALIATVGYVAVGKAIWFVQHQTFSLLDALFDLCVGSLVWSLALPLDVGYPIAGLVFVALCAAIAAGSNNQWGSPS